MTVNQLVKELLNISKTVGPRTRVCVDWKRLYDIETLSHPEIIEIETKTIPWRADNGSFEKSDGSERLRTVVVLK